MARMPCSRPSALMAGLRIEDEVSQSCIRCSVAVGFANSNGTRRYPAFSDEGKRSALIELDRHGENDEEWPLAPVSCWAIPAQGFNLCMQN